MESSNEDDWSAEEMEESEEWELRTERDELPEIEGVNSEDWSVEVEEELDAVYHDEDINDQNRSNNNFNLHLNHGWQAGQAVRPQRIVRRGSDLYREEWIVSQPRNVDNTNLRENGLFRMG